MTYFESAEGIEVTKARAYKEFQSHGAEMDWEEFVSSEGEHETYDAQDVLSWLGY